eukprot:s33_g54.t1
MPPSLRRPWGRWLLFLAFLFVPTLLPQSTEDFAAIDAIAAPRSKGRKKRRSREGPAISMENQARLRSLQNLPEKSEEALAVIQEVIQKPETLTRVKEVQAFISACGRLHFWREALDLLELKRTGAWPVGDIVLTNAAMSACSQVGNWEAVLGLLEDAPRHSVSPDIISYNLAMGACCNGGQWERVLSLGNDLQQVKGRKDFATFNVTLHACVQGGQWELGLACLNQMLALDLQPTWTMYNLGILLSREGLWQLGLSYLQDMWSRLVMPDATTYASTVEAMTCDAAQAAQQWRPALALLASMRRKGFPVPPETREAVARACDEAGEAEVAQRVRLKG